MINDSEKETLEQIVIASGKNQLAIVETRDKRTGKRVAVVCRVIEPNEKFDEYRIYPLAVVVPDSDFQEYTNPLEEQCHDTTGN